MTFSLVARSQDGTQWGIAVASKFLAVGAVVPAARYGVGAIATQSFANVAYKADGLHLLRRGLSAQDVVDKLTAADDDRDQRQLGVVDLDGTAATFTGKACHDWAGGRTGDGYAAQGNILTGPEVVNALAEAFEGTAGSLATRLTTALLAADRAGGDSRGRQSAAVYVVSEGGGYGGGDDVLVDLRVDDHEDPVPELRRLVELHEVFFGAPDPDALLPLTEELRAELEHRLSRLGHASLAEWAGVANVEGRLVEGGVDPVVLEHLRAADLAAQL